MKRCNEPEIRQKYVHFETFFAKLGGNFGEEKLCSSLANIFFQVLKNFDSNNMIQRCESLNFRVYTRFRIYRVLMKKRVF